ncbi:phage portal protein [Muricoccus radiodurans]|uniref:phage portal protein n=1 Tax=Muricoccus radiodurans TaxID=2231721 RepID=UPI003CF46281
MAGILARLLGLETRSTPSPPATLEDVLGVQSTASGVHVSAGAAEGLAAVSACVGAISSAVASLIPRVYFVSAQGRAELPNHPVARLLRDPNPHQAGGDLIEWLVASALLHGNALAAIEHDAAGRAISLRPLPWPSVAVVRLASGRLAYDVTEGTGRTRRYLQDEVLHMRDRSDDGVIGRSRISRTRDAVGNALALQSWSGNTWRNQATPAGAVKMPEGKRMSEPAYKRFKSEFNAAFAGTGNARRTLILEEGASWQSISVSPEDAEVLASRKFTTEEIARIFNVPPPIIQDYSNSTFTNAAQASIWFATFCIQPWCRKLESAFRRNVFGLADREDHELEFDLSTLLRGDPEARWKSHEIAVKSGILDPDEIREVEGWNPRPAAGAAGG